MQVLNLATPNYVVRAANPKLMNGVMAEIKIPLPPLEIQKQIVEECEKVETQYQTIRMSIEKYEELIKAILVKSGICDNEAQELQILTQDLETLHQEFDYDILFKALQERVLEFAPDASENPGLNPATTANPDSLSHFTGLNSTTQNPAAPAGTFENANELSALLKPLELNALLASIPTPPADGWARVKLGEVISLEYGKALQESKRIQGEYPVMGSNGIIGYHNEYLIKAPAIIVGRKGSAGKVTFIEKNCYPIDTTFYVVDRQNNNLRFLFFVLQNLNLEKSQMGIGTPGINRNDIYALKIPLPPLEIQEKIISAIELIEKRIKLIDASLENLEAQKAKILKDNLSHERERLAKLKNSLRLQKIFLQYFINTILQKAGILEINVINAFYSMGNSYSQIESKDVSLNAQHDVGGHSERSEESLRNKELLKDVSHSLNMTNLDSSTNLENHKTPLNLNTLLDLSPPRQKRILKYSSLVIAKSLA